MFLSSAGTQYRRAADDLDVLFLRANRQRDLDTLHRPERDLDSRMGDLPKTGLGRKNFVLGGSEIAEGVFALRARTCGPDSVISGDIAQRQHDVG